VSSSRVFGLKKISPKSFGPHCVWLDSNHFLHFFKTLNYSCSGVK
jgi:hypothetical protein